MVSKYQQASVGIQNASFWMLIDTRIVSACVNVTGACANTIFVVVKCHIYQDKRCLGSIVQN